MADPIISHQPDHSRWQLNKSDLWALLILAAIVGLSAAPVLTGKGDPFTVSLRGFSPWKSHLTETDSTTSESLCYDPITQTYAWTAFANERLENGDLPLWNPHMFSGTPFIANRLTGLTNPLVLGPVFLFPPLTSLAIIYLGHYLLAAWFMYLFLKAIGISRPAALFGAIAYILQGSYDPWLCIVATDKAYLPVTFYYLVRVCDRRDLIGIGGFVFSFFLLSVTGYPQDVVFEVYLMAAWVLFACGPGVRPALKRLGGLAFLLVLAFLLSAIQNLPSFEFYSNSLRALPEYKEAFYSLSRIERLDSPLTLLAVFFPRLWGDYMSGQPSVLPLMALQVRNLAYVGILAAVSALFAGTVWRNVRARFFTVVAVIGCVFVSWSGIYVFVIRILPGARISTARPDFLTLTSIIIVAAFVLDHVVAKIKTDRVLARRVSQLSVLLLGAFLGLLVVTLYAVFNPTLLPRDYTNALREITVGTAIVTAAASMLRAYAHYRFKAGWVWVVLISLLVIDLLPYHIHFHPIVPAGRAVFSTPEIEFLQDSMEADGPFRIFRDHDRVLPPNTPMLFGLDDMTGFDSLQSALYGGFFLSIDPVMARDSRFQDMPSRPEVWSENFWDFLNVRYFVSAGPMNNLPSKWRETQVGALYIYENTDWLPRWFLVSRVRPVDSIAEGYAEVREINPAEVAVVKDFPPDRIGHGLAFDETTDAVAQEQSEPGSIQVAKLSPDEVIFDVSCPEERFLVFSDSYFPAWHAWIDDEETTVYLTDAVIKGVIVPAGRHNVVFRYEPVSYKYGWIITALGLLLLAFGYRLIARLFESGTYSR
jgi:hypothetical protein